ncbi:hypothetical protein HD806DRAFT_509102, partial [Xylariaceae sp. AK1471]
MLRYISLVRAAQSMSLLTPTTILTFTICTASSRMTLSTSCLTSTSPSLPALVLFSYSTPCIKEGKGGDKDIIKLSLLIRIRAKGRYL